MKIYTGGGDRGKTSLFSGERVEKSHDRIEAYGDMDELSSVLGVLASVLPGSCNEIIEEIQLIQSWLLKAGAWLATTPDSHAVDLLEGFGDTPGKTLEASIDKLDANLPPLKEFILPGGHLAASIAHMGRTVCRRAERHVIRAHEAGGGEKADEEIQEVIVFLNRLSDYLFVLARHCNRIMAISDIPWRK